MKQILLLISSLSASWIAENVKDEFLRERTPNPFILDTNGYLSSKFIAELKEKIKIEFPNTQVSFFLLSSIDERYKDRKTQEVSLRLFFKKFINLLKKTGYSAPNSLYIIFSIKDRKFSVRSKPQLSSWSTRKNLAEKEVLVLLRDEKYEEALMYVLQQLKSPFSSQNNSEKFINPSFGKNITLNLIESFPKESSLFSKNVTIPLSHDIASASNTNDTYHNNYTNENNNFIQTDQVNKEKDHNALVDKIKYQVINTNPGLQINNYKFHHDSSNVVPDYYNQNISRNLKRKDSNISPFAMTCSIFILIIVIIIVIACQRKTNNNSSQQLHTHPEKVTSVSPFYPEINNFSKFSLPCGHSFDMNFKNSIVQENKCPQCFRLIINPA